MALICEHILYMSLLIKCDFKLRSLCIFRDFGLKYVYLQRPSAATTGPATAAGYVKKRVFTLSACELFDQWANVMQPMKECGIFYTRVHSFYRLSSISGLGLHWFRLYPSRITYQYYLNMHPSSAKIFQVYAFMLNQFQQHNRLPVPLAASEGGRRFWVNSKKAVRVDCNNF